MPTRWTLLSALVHAATVVLLVVIPLLARDELPVPPRGPVVGTVHLAAPTPPPPTPPPVVPHARAAGRSAIPDVGRRAAPARTVVPTDVPDTLPGPGDEAPPGDPTTGAGEAACCGPALPGDGAGGLAGHGAGDAGQGPHRVGGDIREPRKVHHVAPVYPELARRAGLGGVVEIDCVIDPRGDVKELTVLRGHPLLDDAAVDAVRKWRYSPTLLNGVPVPVRLTVVVRFTSLHR